MRDKISIIISCYNTSKYLEKCINSLLQQTYSNIELIFIDDGSVDNTYQILKKYANDKRVIILKNEKNKGLSYSRNKGVEKSTGEYIGFIDSDDYIEKDYYKNLFNAIKQKNADMAICDMKLIYENENNREQIVYASESEKGSKLDFINNGLAASACNKLFKREIITKYSFAEGKLNEDIAVIIPAIVYSKKIAYVKNTFYNYVQRDNSIQNSQFSYKRFDIFDGVKTTLERLPKDNLYEGYKDAIVFNQIIVILIYIIPKEKNIIRRRNIIKKFVELSEEYSVRKNKYWWRTLDTLGKKYRFYYKLMFRLAYHKLYLLASLLIKVADVYKSTSHINLPSNISFDELKRLAIKNQKRKNKLSLSVIIPNYNYACFLKERLYSILYQKVKISEIIILDDCSTDTSKALIQEIIDNLNSIIQIKFLENKKNSGSPFKQWKKGIKAAESDYVWIAEADDYCHKNFLKEIHNLLKKDSNIVIAYTDTAFIKKNGEYINKTIKNEIDILNTGHWDKSYINSGKKEFNNYTYLNCTIANVSSCVIKRNDYDNILKLAGQFYQSGDWLFYALVMQNGKIAYSNKNYNYYRVHGNNVSSITKKEAYIKELLKIYDYYDKNFHITKKQKREQDKRIQLLKKNWDLK